MIATSLWWREPRRFFPRSRRPTRPVSGPCPASLPIETSPGRANAVAFARPAGVESGTSSPSSVVPTLDSVGVASRDERFGRVWWRMCSGLYLRPWAAARARGFIGRGFAVSGKRDDAAPGAAGEARFGPQIGSATAPHQCGKVTRWISGYPRERSAFFQARSRWSCRYQPFRDCGIMPHLSFRLSERGRLRRAAVPCRLACGLTVSGSLSRSRAARAENRAVAPALAAWGFAPAAPDPAPARNLHNSRANSPARRDQMPSGGRAVEARRFVHEQPIGIRGERDAHPGTARGPGPEAPCPRGGLIRRRPGPRPGSNASAPSNRRYEACPFALTVGG